MDRENRLGAEWPPELTKALATCRVFVPLYSRRYFESDNCGKEWFAFARREVNHNARGRPAVNAIVPALWTSLGRATLPDVAQSIQYHHSDLGERYSTEGFYGIMKLQQYRADYQRAVHRLAERIVDVRRGDRRLRSSEERSTTTSRCRAPSARPASSRQRQISCRSPCWRTILRRCRRAGPADYYGARRTPGARTSPDYPQPLADYAGSWPGNAWTASPWSDRPRMPSWPGRSGGGADTAEPVPRGRLGEPVRGASRAAAAAERRRGVLGQRARALECAGPADAQAPSMTSASSLQQYPRPQTRQRAAAGARWRPAGFPPCRISASFCPR